MKKGLTSAEAIKMFSITKKMYKLMDKTLDKQEYEFLLKALRKGSYGVYSLDSSKPITISDDVLKCFMGVMFYEYGVGKEDSMPSWSMYSGYTEDNFNRIMSGVESQSVSPLSNINTALDNGATLRCSSNKNKGNKSFTLTNPFNENYAREIYVNSNTFSGGLTEVNSIASLCLKGLDKEKSN